MQSKVDDSLTTTTAATIDLNFKNDTVTDDGDENSDYYDDNNIADYKNEWIYLWARAQCMCYYNTQHIQSWAFPLNRANLLILKLVAFAVCAISCQNENRKNKILDVSLSLRFNLISIYCQ